jgi:ribosome-associated protein
MDEKINVPDLSGASSQLIAEQVIRILNERKSHNLKLLHVEDKTVLTDYLVICTGNSSTQVRSLAAEVEYRMGLSGVKVWNMDGYSTGEWVVVDMGSVMVHIFFRETREFYKLEKLWADSEEIDISELLES